MKIKQNLGALVLAGFTALGIGGCKENKDNVQIIEPEFVTCGCYRGDWTTYAYINNNGKIGCVAAKGMDKNFFDSLGKFKLTLGNLVPEVNRTAEFGHLDGGVTKEKIDCYQLLNYEELK